MLHFFREFFQVFFSEAAKEILGKCLKEEKKVKAIKNRLLIQANAFFVKLCLLMSHLNALNNLKILKLTL